MASKREDVALIVLIISKQCVPKVDAVKNPVE